MTSLRRLSALAVTGTVAFAAAVTAAAAASPPPIELGAAETFGVLGATTVTSAGVSTVTDDLGVSPGTAITGFPPGVFGSIHPGDPAAGNAHADLATAYGDAVGREPAAPAGVLDGLTLEPGIYRSGASLALAGTLTLDGKGDPNAVFIFQAGSTLLTAAASRVELTGGAQACNVFWQVGSSATLGASSLLKGSILAMTSISMGDGVKVDGRALARDGAVTLINDTVTISSCAGSLTHTAPEIAPFAVELTGRTQTVHCVLGAWSVTDSTGSDDGYTLTVSATRPTVDGSVADAGTGVQMTLTTTDATPAVGNTAVNGPRATSPRLLATTAHTIATAVEGSGQGQWHFAADAGGAASLAIVIPGDAAAGAFSSTLTFTTARPAP